MTPTLTLDYAAPTTDKHRLSRRAARWLIALCGLIAVAALALLLYDVETVVLTGPLLFLLACVGLVPAIRAGGVVPLTIFVAHAAICLLFVALVNLRGWGPSDAGPPFKVMGGLYVAVGLPAWAWQWHRLGRPG